MPSSQSARKGQSSNSKWIGLLLAWRRAAWGRNQTELMVTSMRPENLVRKTRFSKLAKQSGLGPQPNGTQGYVITACNLC